MLYLKARAGIEVLDEYNGEKGIFLKTFAMNDRRNKNGWRATWDSIKKYIKTFVENARPGIVYEKCEGTVCDLDHTDGTTKELNVTAQEPFRRTTIINYTLNEDTHTAYFIHKLDATKEETEEFLEQIRSGEIEFVSPSIWPEIGGFDILGTMPNGLPKIDAYKWEGLHDAFVTKPAFGDEARITAVCEGEDCPMRLLTAKQLQAEDELGPIKQVPILVKHKDKLRFISVSQEVADKLNASLENDIALNEELVLKTIRETENTSFSSCSCSKNQMDPKEELQQAKKAMEENEKKVKELESKLKANEEEKKELEAKLKAAEENSDDEKVKSAKKAQEEAEDEAKQAKKAAEEKENENKELKARIAEPLIAAIIKNRETAGMPKDQLERLQTSLQAKSIDEIEEKYNEDKFLMSNLSASETPDNPTHFDWNEGATGPLAAKSLEETFEEVSA